MQAQVSLLMDQYDIVLPQLPDLDFSSVQVEWERLKSNIPEVWKFNRDGREFMVGEAIKERGLDAEFPVVLIPGVISTVRVIAISFRSETDASSTLGTRVLVDCARLPHVLPREALGRLQHGYSSHFQSGQVDWGDDARPRYGFGSTGRKASRSRGY